jgi:hypothetical protein
MQPSAPIAGLEVPENVRRILIDVVRTAREWFVADVPSVVLYGRPAEGQHPTASYLSPEEVRRGHRTNRVR